MSNIDLIRMALQAILPCYESNGSLYDDYSSNVILENISKSDFKKLEKLAFA